MSMIFKLSFVVLLAVLASVSVESGIVKREIQTENQSGVQAPASTPAPAPASSRTPTRKPRKICDPSLACGWAVYTPFTRVIEYFMKNSCDCPATQNCVRVGDDPSMNAFLYKCLDKRPIVATPSPFDDQGE